MAGPRSICPWPFAAAVIFLLTISMPWPLDRLLERGEDGMPGYRPFRRVAPLVADDFRSEAAGRKIERSLRNRSYLGRAFASHHSEWIYRIFGRPSPSARLGRDRWLFSPDRLRERPPSFWTRRAEQDAAVIERVRDRLRASDAALIVALVPDRARVVADRAYRGGRMPPGRAGFLPAVVAALERRKVPTFDMTTPLRVMRSSPHPPFDRDDHHWTSRGARAAVDALLDRVVALHDLPIASADQVEVSFEPSVVPFASMLSHLGFRRGGELEQRFRDDREVVRFRGAFPDGGPPCATYWSTSFGRLGSAGFFAARIACPVRQIVESAKGSSALPVGDLPEIARLRDGTRRHVVIWEIPEYHLAGHDEGGPARQFAELDVWLDQDDF